VQLPTHPASHKSLRVDYRLMTLPPELDLNFKAELDSFEAEQQMTLHDKHRTHSQSADSTGVDR
jgi:hypothetical protein